MCSCFFLSCEGETGVQAHRLQEELVATVFFPLDLCRELVLIWALFNFPVTLFNPRLQIWIQMCQSRHVEAKCFVSRTLGEFFWTAIMKIN